jgi:hypothetical protein
MVVEQTVVVVREDKRVTPNLGEAFDFTQEEIDQISASSPEALREPRDESKPEAEGDDPLRPTVGAKGEKDAAAGGKVSGEQPYNIAGPTKPGAKGSKTAPEAGTPREGDDTGL